jgi:hypothetical protein
VSATLRRIAQDERHDNLVVMDARPVDRRLFGNWWMGLPFLRGNHAGLYRKHGIGERLNPRIMTGEQAVALAQELASGVGRTAAPDRIDDGLSFPRQTIYFW